MTETNGSTVPSTEQLDSEHFSPYRADGKLVGTDEFKDHVRCLT